MSAIGRRILAILAAIGAVAAIVWRGIAKIQKAAAERAVSRLEKKDRENADEIRNSADRARNDPDVVRRFGQFGRRRR